MVTAEHLPQIADHVRDTSHGKRESCFLDLRSTAGKARLMELVKDADVLVNGYRPGQLQKFGFGVDDLLRMRPGIVVVSVSCFGRWRAIRRPCRMGAGRSIRHRRLRNQRALDRSTQTEAALRAGERLHDGLSCCLRRPIGAEAPRDLRAAAITYRRRSANPQCSCSARD